jgi:flavorubredoxin
MNTTTIYQADYQWIMLSRHNDPSKKIIDTNQYLLRTRSRCLLVDPGGIELFAPMLAAVLHHAPVEEITDLFSSHHDPDVISSLGLWDQALPNAKLHAATIWEGFLRHFGCNNIDYIPIPDQGGSIKLDDAELQIIPAHYLHASANFNLYDPQAKLLMSGDIGSALEKAGAPLYVENFNDHIEKMRYFHQRWMPCNQAKMRWIERIRHLDLEIMAPQHGRIFRGDDIQRFLDWFEKLEVGIAG